jgi:hypothetical protein
MNKLLLIPLLVLITACQGPEKKEATKKSPSVKEQKENIIQLSTKHKPNIIYCDMDGDKRKDTVQLVLNTSNYKYGLAIKFGNKKTKYLGMGEDVLGRGFDDLEWVGIFEKVPKGEVIYNNVIGGEIITEEQVDEKDKIKLHNDGILIHQLEFCGGGIIYFEKGKLKWVQQE